MIKRDISRELLQSAKEYPVVTILGPRQSGKTTLAQMTFDVGLAAYLLGIHSAMQASRDPLRGNLYENLIIADIVKSALNAGIRPEIYFYRDSKGNKIDLLIREKGRLVPVEIKSAETFSESFLKAFDMFGRLSLANTDSGFLLYNGDKRFNIRQTRIINPFAEKEIWLVLTGNKA